MSTSRFVRVRALPVATSGMALALAAALISGLAIYLNAFAVKQVPDPAVFTTLKNGVAAAVLLAAIAVAGGRRSTFAIKRQQWPAVVVVGIVGGSVPFILFFTGLAQASAPSAAFIQKTLFVWVALLAVPFLGERLGITSIAAIGLLLGGQALVLPPAGVRWGSGESLILAATLLWAAETVLVKRLLESIPALTLATLRLATGLVVLIGYLAISGRLAGVETLGLAPWAWILVSGGVLASYVATWFAALERAPASAVTSVLVVGAVVTGMLTSLSAGKAPGLTAAAGYTVIVVAVAVVALVATRRRARTLVPEQASA